MDLVKICKSLRKAYETLSLQNAKEKNSALLSVIHAIDKNREAILKANAIDVQNARAAGTSEPLVDRLSLNDKRIDSILESIQIVIDQTDPIGETLSGWVTPGGLKIQQVRVPLGIVGIIYESRPNVTADAFCLAYKSGNALLLRGSSSALESNIAITKAIKEGLQENGIPEAIELVESKSHEDVNEILNAVGLIDVVLPRGGAKLIKTVVENARVPVIETGSGVCHLYVDESANLEKAVLIAENAKIQRPGVCNAIEAILVNRKIMTMFLPMLVDKFKGRVEFHADEQCYEIIKSAAGSLDKNNNCKTSVVKAVDEDYGHEFLDFKCLVKVVDSTDEAIEYINTHNTKHSESIVTESLKNAKLFQRKIDAACVYVNASTRFTDGSEFGFGAELGISTQKLHARGPMGLIALTTTKYIIDGDGQIR